MPFSKLSERKEFSMFLKFHRKAVGWTAAELARQIGVSRSKVNNWEQMRNLPRDLEEVIKKVREVVKAEIRRRRMEEWFTNVASKRA